MPEPLWKSSLRSLLTAFSAVVGICLAFIPIAFFISSVETSDESISTDFKTEILPNAKGVRKKISKNAPVILQVDIDGVIGLQELTQSSIEKLLVESQEGSLSGGLVKAILLRINTPGGTINDADGIYRALKGYKERYKTPIIAHVDGLCASGGMYVACAADAIYASDVGIIGSIGVITPPFLNVSKLMEKVGVDALTISKGKGKDDLDPLRPWKSDEANNIESLTAYYYESFVDLVAKNRPKVSREALKNEYGAHIFPAAEAAKFGLIDGISLSRDATLEKLLALLSIEDDYYQVVRMSSTSWLTELLKTESPLVTGKIKHDWRLDSGLCNEGLLGRFANEPLFLFRP